MLKKAIAMGFAALIGLAGAAKAEDNHIDTIRSDAPELAQYGKFSVGVKTLKRMLSWKRRCYYRSTRS